MADHSIRGKVALIAGGAKNLGGLIARDLAAQGASAIAIHYNSPASKPVALQGDLTTAKAVEKLFADTVAAVGRPDIAINTVGKVLKKPMLDISEAEYDEMTAVNSKAAFFFLKEAGRHVNDNGKIVTLVTSLLGAFTPFYVSYAGTKAPVEHFSRAAAKEFGARGISVTAIGPGPMDTPFFYGQEGPDAVVGLSAHGQALVRFWREAGMVEWFAKSPDFDRRLRERFLPLHEAAAAGWHDDWQASAQGALALLILLDQGDLVEVMPDSRAAPMPVSLLYPHRRQRSRRLEVFQDWFETLMRPHLEA